MTTTLSEFRKAYATAKRAKKEEFIFDGKHFDITFASYMIQYLERCGFGGDKQLNFTQEAFTA